MDAIEQFLGMERFVKSGDIVRLRGIYMAILAFVFIQLLNIVQMVISYKGWTLDATISVAAVSFVLAILVSYRYHDKFYVAAIGIMALTVFGIGFSAVDKSTGVNSALLPFLPVCIIMGGIISGWRMAIIMGVLSVVFVGLLLQMSNFAGATSIYDPALFATQNFQRASQVSFACILASLVTASYSFAMHGLFQRDEDSLEKVRQAERNRTEFFSELSHEIRTPLNGIVGMSGLLLKSELNSQQLQYATIVNDCSENLLDVMSNVMEISQIDNDRIALKPTIFNVHDMARELVVRHESSLKANPKLTIGMHVAPNVPKFIHADKKRIKLIANHLIKNAITFTDTGTINLILDGNIVQNNQFKLCVYVRDTGVGIKKENLNSIYDRFHQVDNSLSRKYEGSGLGLSICKEIIEFMGGNIGVVSEFGTGSTFYIDLIVPMAHMNSQAPSGNKKASDEHSLSLDDKILPFRKASNS